jgi:hypothetical protein
MELEIPDITNEVWHVEAGGQVYETNLGEIEQWIAEGSLLRIDRVRKGNLRWIEAGKVPALTDFFNAKDAAEPPPRVITTTHTEVLGVPTGFSAARPDPTYGNASGPHVQVPATAGGTGTTVCAVHDDVPAAYLCDTCSNSFCKACPTSYGGTVKICPFCGAMCASIEKMSQTRAESDRRQSAVTDGFGFGDFGKALAHPFRFKFSLAVGAIMFAIFSIGQSAAGMGNIFLMGAGIISFMMANMLWFGVLGHTVDNFVQGRLDENFMPSFEDFDIWEDVVHPFFLSIGAYIVSFGPFIVVVLVAVFMVMGAVRGEINDMQTQAAAAVNQELPYASKAADQTKTVRELLDRAQQKQRQQIAEVENEARDAEEFAYADPTDDTQPGTLRPAGPDGGLPQHAIDEDKEFEKLNEMINQQRKSQLESTIGKTPETKAAEQQAFFQRLLGYGVVFLLLGGVTLLWGLFYFPAACAVAGYTRSFVVTINPLVGLDTIKRLGGTYLLILVMGLALALMSGMVSGVFELIFSPFDMPTVGNLPARFFGSMFGFYISVVFSCLLGYALFKKADVLDLPA